jgi:hypothetical protein
MHEPKMANNNVEKNNPLSSCVVLCCVNLGSYALNQIEICRSAVDTHCIVIFHEMELAHKWNAPLVQSDRDGA